MDDNITVFDILADLLMLKHLKDNIYVNPDGVKYIKDNYGFHTVIQYNNLLLLHKTEELKKREKSVEDYEQRYEKLLKREAVAVNKKNAAVMKHIIGSNLTDSEKLEHLKSYLKSK